MWIPVEEMIIKRGKERSRRTSSCALSSFQFYAISGKVKARASFNRRQYDRTSNGTVSIPQRILALFIVLSLFRPSRFHWHVAVIDEFPSKLSCILEYSTFYEEKKRSCTLWAVFGEVKNKNLNLRRESIYEKYSRVFILSIGGGNKKVLAEM